MRNPARGKRPRASGGERPSANPVDELAARAVADVLEWAGTSQERDARLDLVNTPKRVVKMYEELLSSYRPGAYAALVSSFTTFPARESEAIHIGPIAFYSLCSHHMLPFTGSAWVSYIPRNRIMGLSKAARVVEFFSRKLQLQERFTGEVADFLMEQLRPKAVMVHVDAEHFCMSMRGVRSPGARTKTTELRGLAKTDASVRAEFLGSLPR